MSAAPNKKEAAPDDKDAAQGAVKRETNDLSTTTPLPLDSQVEADGLPEIESMDSFLAKSLPVVEPVDYGDDESDMEAWAQCIEPIPANWLDEITKDPLTQKVILMVNHLSPEDRSEYEEKFNIPHSKPPEPKGDYDGNEYKKINAVDFPQPAEPEAFYGIAGEVTEILCTGSELKPEAVLAQFLCIFGNMLGRSAFKNQGGRHGTLINVAIIGNTADGGKGESYQAVSDLVFYVNPDYHLCKLRGGYQSSEALIADITDEVTKLNKKEQRELIEAGIDDKRLVVVEEEFSRILQIGKRDGTTMSEILRQCYDLPRKLTASSRKASLVSTNPFVSILGHITPEALRSCMPTVEAFNGFANRFTFIASQRTGIVPEPAVIKWCTGKPREIISKLQEILKTFRPCSNDCSQNKEREFRFSETASKQWVEIYHELSMKAKGKSGMPGAIIARAKPTILRLAIIYAALDNQTLIEPVHLSAAKALWDYASRSALWAFGSASGNGDSDKILKFLRRRGNKGANRTLIAEEVFSKHKPSASLTEDLSLLQHSGLAVIKRVKGSDVWFAT